MYHSRLPEPGRKPGGVEVFVDRLARALTRRGHEVTLHTFSTRLPAAPYAVRRLRPVRAGGAPILRQYVAPWLLNVRPKMDYDVFHFHGDDWFCFRRPVPTVRTFYGSALLESLNATSLKRRIDQGIVFMLEQLAGRLADARYGIGPDSRLLYRGDGVLQIGVDPPAGDRAPSPAPSILFIGTWDGRKRGRLLHEAFQRSVRPRFPDAELWMVSDRCEAGPGVTWHQEPSDAEIEGLFQRAWVFSLPSSYEGFGIPYLDAMARSVPVVATPNPGADDLLGRGTAGLIVEADQLGDALNRVIQDESLRSQLGASGHARAADFHWDNICERYEAAYALAAERFRRRRDG